MSSAEAWTINSSKSDANDGDADVEDEEDDKADGIGGGGSSRGTNAVSAADEIEARQSGHVGVGSVRAIQSEMPACESEQARRPATKRNGIIVRI